MRKAATTPCEMTSNVDREGGWVDTKDVSAADEKNMSQTPRTPPPPPPQRVEAESASSQIHQNHTIIDWEFQIFWQIVNSNGSTPVFFNQPFADYVLTLHLTIYNVTFVKNGGMLLSEKSREQESQNWEFQSFCNTSSR
jgi:hypothetical protein